MNKIIKKILIANLFLLSMFLIGCKDPNKEIYDGMIECVQTTEYLEGYEFVECRARSAETIWGWLAGEKSGYDYIFKNKEDDYRTIWITNDGLDEEQSVCLNMSLNFVGFETKHYSCKECDNIFLNVTVGEDGYIIEETYSDVGKD